MNTTTVYVVEGWIYEAYGFRWPHERKNDSTRRLISVAPSRGIWILRDQGHACEEVLRISDFMNGDPPADSPFWRTITASLAVALEIFPAALEAAVEEAVYDIITDPDLIAGCCGGVGPMAGRGQISNSEFRRLQMEIFDRRRRQEASGKVRQETLRRRRSQFASVRDARILEMLDRGVPYVCAQPNCGRRADLTIDHITPLSRGGVDDVENLQFMCRSHNSQKSNRLPASLRQLVGGDE